MADDADYAADYQQTAVDIQTKNIRTAVAAMPKGQPGECVKCGEDSPRLVNGVCARCRDKYNLP